MVKKKVRIKLSILLVLTMLLSLLSGCAKTTENGGGAEDASAGIGSAVGDIASNKDSSSENTAMGRYIEEVTDLTEFIVGYGNGLHKLSDGDLVLSGFYEAFHISKDNGVTWEEDKRAWQESMLENQTYILDMAVSPDNTVAVIYDDGQGKMQEDGTPKLHPQLLIVKPDGSEISLDVQVPEDERYIRGVAVSDDGRIFVSVLAPYIYEVKEDGSKEIYLTIEKGSFPEFMKIQGNLMILDDGSYNVPIIYDMEKEEYIEDKVFEDFIKENYSSRNSQLGDWYETYFFIGEEGVIYIAGKKGLHRHVLGGSAVEQVIDGSLCSLSNPAYQIVGMTMLENNEFLTLFNGGTQVRYVYDPNVPTVPNQILKVYSLTENDTIRQAVSLYQTANPEVFASYETGMTEGDSVTREDALKTLNTKIMAGEGPDVLVLDRMPLASYIEKGLLVDLAPLLDNLSGDEELFGNLVDAMRTDGKVYAMPCEIQVPLILGKPEYVSKAGDLQGVAEMVEALRKDNPGEDIFNIASKKGVLRFFAMTSVPAWTTENGDLDKDAVKEYLTQIKRIYDAQMDGLPSKIIEAYNKSNESFIQTYGVNRDNSEYLRTSLNPLRYIYDQLKVVPGALDGAYNYANLISVNKADGYEDTEIVSMGGQADHVFCAGTLLGINASSGSISLAQDFIKICLGKENQSKLFQGLAVNKAGFEESFHAYDDKLGPDNSWGGVCSSDSEGNRYDMDIYWPDEAQVGKLQKFIEDAGTPYIEDIVLENTVYEEGEAYLNGAQSLDETVNNIEKKISIYMAE